MTRTTIQIKKTDKVLLDGFMRKHNIKRSHEAFSKLIGNEDIVITPEKKLITKSKKVISSPKKVISNDTRELTEHEKREFGENADPVLLDRLYEARRRNRI